MSILDRVNNYVRIVPIRMMVTVDTFTSYDNLECVNTPPRNMDAKTWLEDIAEVMFYKETNSGTINYNDGHTETLYSFVDYEEILSAAFKTIDYYNDLPKIMAEKAKAEAESRAAQKDNLWVQKVRAKDKLNFLADKYINEITSTYPVFETLTFQDQYAEALRYKSESFADTPMIGSIASARGMSKEELADKIIAKSEAYKLLAAKTAGLRQKYEKQIDSAETVTEVMTIMENIVFTEV